MDCSEMNYTESRCHSKAHALSVRTDPSQRALDKNQCNWPPYFDVHTTQEDHDEAIARFDQAILNASKRLGHKRVEYLNDIQNWKQHMNQQKMFLKVMKHLLKQGEPSMEGDSNDVRCKYRFVKPDGTKLACAIGCFIPDEVYEFEFEGKPIDMLMWDGRLTELFNGLTEDFLAGLQQLHDDAATYTAVELLYGKTFNEILMEQACIFACSYSLDMAPIEQLPGARP